jgi:glycosyltransferase involved in cell wall biosynthesis
LLHSIGFWIYRWITTNSQNVIVHTDVAYNALTGKVGVSKTKAVVIPHPVSAPPKEATTPEDLRARFALDNTRVLLVFGFIHVDKGLDDLIRGLSILRASANTSLDGIRVVIAGSVRPRNGVFRALEARDRLHLARVLKLAKRNGLEDFLLLTGYVPDSDVAAWFRIAEAVILPYKRAEQSGVASLATTFGVPVLASTVGGLAEQISGSPWSFPPRAPDQIAVALANFLHTLPAEQQVLNVSVRSSDLTSVVTATSELYNVAAGRR